MIKSIMMFIVLCAAPCIAQEPTTDQALDAICVEHKCSLYTWNTLYGGPKPNRIIFVLSFGSGQDSVGKRFKSDNWYFITADTKEELLEKAKMGVSYSKGGVFFNKNKGPWKSTPVKFSDGEISHYVIKDVEGNDIALILNREFAEDFAKHLSDSIYNFSRKLEND